MTDDIGAAVFGWGLTLAFGWWWWRCLQSGVAYYRRGKYTRSADPLYYRRTMIAFAISIVVLGVCSVWLTLRAFSS